MIDRRRLRDFWLDIRDSALEQIEYELTEHLNVRNIILFLVNVVVVGYVIITSWLGDETPVQSKPASTPAQQDQAESSSPPTLTFQDKTIAKTAAEVFIRYYMTYDTNQVNRASKIEKISMPAIYQRVKEEDETIRPTADLRSSRWVKTENSFIQVSNQDGFLWTGTVLTEITDMKGNKRQEKNNVAISLERSALKPTDWLVSEVTVYDSNS